MSVLDSVSVLDSLDVANILSPGAVDESTNIKFLMYYTELLWYAQFWPPSSYQIDGAFYSPIFESCLSRYEI